MGDLLSEERQQAALAFLSEEAPPQDPEVQTTEGPGGAPDDAVSTAGDVASSGEAEAGEAPAPYSDGGDTGSPASEAASAPDGEPVVETDGASETAGHAVPYTRFKSVIDQKNEWMGRARGTEGQLLARDERIKELEAQLSSRPAQVAPQQTADQAEREWLDGFLNGDGSAEPTAPIQKWEMPPEMAAQMTEMQTFMRDQRVQGHVSDAVGRVDKAIAGSPTIMRDELLRHVQGQMHRGEAPKTSVDSFVTIHTSAYEAGRQDALAELAAPSASAPMSAPPTNGSPGPPPRPRDTGAPQTTHGPGSAKPRTMEDAFNAASEWLENQPQ